MLAITVTTESTSPLREPDETQVRAAVAHVGGETDRYVTAERNSADGNVFIQAWREGTGPYEVDYCDGDLTATHRVELSDPEAVTDLFTAWARGDESWRAEHQWQQLEGVPAKTRADTEDRALTLVKTGFRTWGDVVESVIDDGEVSEEMAEQIVTRVWDRRLAEQESWPEKTDADRLLAVFDDLERQGIAAEPDFACCMSCADAEIGGAAADDSRGYVFFLYQDSESAAEGHGVWLSYGHFEGSGMEQVEVGREVAAALTAAGLPFTWDGSPKTSIHVTPLDWRLRLPEDEEDDD